MSSTTTFGLDPNLQYVYPDKGIVPTQILFCMKVLSYFNDLFRMPSLTALL
jgi:hypothetical protein